MAFEVARRQLVGSVELAQAVDSITKGDAVYINAAGYCSNSGVATQDKVYGVAAETSDNSGGSAGDLSIAVHPAVSGQKFRALTNGTPVQTDVGEAVDLTSATTIIETTRNYQHFLIEELEDAANKKVIGEFVNTQQGANYGGA
jgi:hypothetical protein